MYQTLRDRQVLRTFDPATKKWKDVPRGQDPFKLPSVSGWEKELLQGEYGDYVAISTPLPEEDESTAFFREIGLNIQVVKSHPEIYHYRDETEMMEEWGALLYG